MYPTSRVIGSTRTPEGPTMQEFSTAVAAELADTQAKEDGETPLPPIKTKIDGRKITLHPMTSDQMALAMYAVSNGRIEEQIGSIINIWFGMLGDDPKEERHYRRRLWDRDDKFGVPMMVDMIKAAVAEWSGKDTPPAGD